MRALESHDNPHRIIAEASGELTEMAKTLLPREKSLKKLCQRIRPMPTNPTSLFDLHIDSNLKSLGGNSFLLFDTGPGSDRMVILEPKKIKRFSPLHQFGWQMARLRWFLVSLHNSILCMHLLEEFTLFAMDTYCLRYIYYFQGRALYITEECGRLSDSCVLTLIHSTF